MTLKQKIEQELKEAMRNKEELRLSVLRMLSSAMHNKEIEKRTKLSKNPDAKDLAAQEGEPRLWREKESGLNDEETLGVIRSEAKKRRDSIVEFEKGGRADLVEKESAELKILETYLPQELSDDDLRKIIDEVVIKEGVADVKEFGRIMGKAMGKVKSQASGDRVSKFLRERLENEK